MMAGTGMIELFDGSRVADPNPHPDCGHDDDPGEHPRCARCWWDQTHDVDEHGNVIDLLGGSR